MVKRLNRAESRELTRTRLLDAAADLFARSGYRGTSVDDVTEAAGFTKGAFYYNFESKDDLLLALIERHIAQLAQELERALSGAATLDAKIEAVQRVVRREHSRGAARLEFEVMVNAVRDPKVRTLVRDAQRQWRRAIASLISQQFAEAGATPPLDPDVLALVIQAAAQGLAMTEAIDPTAVPKDAFPAILGLILRQPARDPERRAAV